MNDGIRLPSRALAQQTENSVTSYTSYIDREAGAPSRTAWTPVRVEERLRKAAALREKPTGCDTEFASGAEGIGIIGGIGVAGSAAAADAVVADAAEAMSWLDWLELDVPESCLPGWKGRRGRRSAGGSASAVRPPTDAGVMPCR